MIRFVILLSAAVMVSACVDTATPTNSAGLPTPFVMVGQAGPGMIAAKELTGDGIAVSTNFAGRSAGIKTFCSGNADAILMDSDFTSDEWQICRDLEGEWSAFGTLKGATIYVKHSIAGALLKHAKTTFLN